MKLLLASTSPYRAKLLKQLEVPFSTCAPKYDESKQRHFFDPDEPEAFALHLARGKARSIDPLEESWVLAAAQIALTPQELLHKTSSEEEAVDQLMKLSGRSHRLINAIVLRNSANDEEVHCIDEQSLVMRCFERREAEDYVRKYKPMDCVGSYRIEDAGIKLFESISSNDFTGIIGLPLLSVHLLLRKIRLI